MRIVEGSDAFVASHGHGVVRGDLSSLRAIDRSVQMDMKEIDNWITKATDFADNMDYLISTSSSLAGDVSNRIYPIFEPKDIFLATGRQLDYLATMPSIKEAWLDDKIDLPYYKPDSEGIGVDDPLWRELYSGKIHVGTKRTVVTEYMNKLDDLTPTERATMLFNHQRIANNLSDVLDYTAVEGEVLMIDNTLVTVY